jgi:hypothetical protein
MHCLHPLAAAVFAHCDGHSDPSDIAALAERRLGQPVTEEDVSAAVYQLEQRSLLERPPVVVVGDGISRRDLARKGAKLGAAVASVPLITSIVAPTAAMAVSGIASGCAGCGANSDCVSNNCCQSVDGKQCSPGCCVPVDGSCTAEPANCGSPPAPPCKCVFDASGVPGGCPCICSDPACDRTCCPTQEDLCCGERGE